MKFCSISFLAAILASMTVPAYAKKLPQLGAILGPIYAFDSVVEVCNKNGANVPEDELKQVQSFVLGMENLVLSGLSEGERDEVIRASEPHVTKWSTEYITSMEQQYPSRNKSAALKYACETGYLRGMINGFTKHQAQIMTGVIAAKID